MHRVLTAGTRLGVYEVIAPIGEGGMGQVYRARDTRLNRDVALKVLPDLFANDAERLARFEHEARTLATLNHPHIAQIYGIAESIVKAGPSGLATDAPTAAIVMELVDGETLAERIARGPLPVGEAIAVACQIAEGLEAAHDAGIIHRDLKPANIKVRPDGTVKVLDFGLAKAAEPSNASLENSPTFTSARTAHGAILGTAAYMSPEQAQGKTVDERADIWAFGVVLFEMLTGKPLFGGDNVSAVLAAVLRDEPSWSQLPPDLPRGIHRLLRRCLQKDPRLRLRHAGDARLELIDIAPDDALRAPPASAKHSTWTRLGIVAVISALMAGAAGFMLARRDTKAADLQLRKWVIPNDVSRDEWVPDDLPAIAPSGTRVAYTDGNRLHIRDLDTLDAREIPGSGFVSSPFWAPDSSTVAFVSDYRSLWKVPATGGTPSKICDLPGGLPFGAVWRPDHTIVVNLAYGPFAGDLFTVREEGGALEPLHARQPNQVGASFFLRGLPDGGLIYGEYRDGAYQTLIEESGKPSRVLAIPQNRGVVYSPTGHLLYADVRAGGIWAIPFNLRAHDVTGKPFRVAEIGEGPTVAADGTLAYGLAAGGLRQLAWVDRDGTFRGAIGQPQENIANPRLSLDGTRVAVEGKENGRWNIWLHEVARSGKSRLTFGTQDFSPAWGPNSRVTFMRDWDLFTITTDGGEPSKSVAEAQPQYDPTWSRDGRYMLYGQFEPRSSSDIWMKEEGQQPKPFMQAQFSENNPRLSPDARYVVYLSDETGTSEVFVRAFPSGAGKTQVSFNGAEAPLWSPRGDEIFFIQGKMLMSAAVRTTPTLKIDTAQPLFEVEIRKSSAGPRFDTLDGQRFVVVRTLKPQRSGVVIVQDWFAEFRGR